MTKHYLGIFMLTIFVIKQMSLDHFYNVMPFKCKGKMLFNIDA